jgi:hypothetical protein
VIVVSVLLAFGIDACWETLGQRNDARSAVAALAADFEEARDHLDAFRTGDL